MKSHDWRWWQMDIGIEREYEPGHRPTIYPGEVAMSEMPADLVDEIIATATAEGLTAIELPVRWRVRPAPGWYAKYLRWRFRFFWWLPFGKPKIKATASLALKETIH